ncbi:hypothetical protein AALP_AA3G280300 [Arabis alpina]|uniref:Uncharacterized protein n=1 Tax=Arabis alpina TaxID=50452 RepID=A0A087HC74_ARAAL|nr:hypothetical protein AALP_AA3G280300 [Arabis alpina]
MLTHDSGNCLVRNRGMGNDGDSEDSEDDQPPGGNAHGGPVIEEMEEAPVEDGPVPEIRNQVHALHQNGPVIDVSDDIGEFRGVLYNELDMSELYNPCPIFANATGDIPGRNAPRIQQFGEDYDELNAFEKLYKVHGDSSDDANLGQRKRKFPESEELGHKSAKLQIEEHGESSGTAQEEVQVGGAVGPKPPEAP